MKMTLKFVRENLPEICIGAARLHGVPVGEPIGTNVVVLVGKDAVLGPSAARSGRPGVGME